MASNAQDVSVVDKWHNFTGYAILFFVFIGTMTIAWRLGNTAKSEGLSAKGGEQTTESVQGSELRIQPSGSWLLALGSLLLAWLVAVEIGVEAWYRMHERDAVANPAWSVRWPQDANSYREIKTNERVRELLRFDSAREALWRSGNSQNYMTVIGAPGETVVLSLKNFCLRGGSSLTLEGTATTTFVINVNKKFSLSGNSHIDLAGLQWNQVLFNVVGKGQRVSLSGNSILQGILMANERRVELNGHSTVSGEIIANRLKLRGSSRVLHPAVVSPIAESQLADSAPLPRRSFASTGMRADLGLEQ